MFILFIGISNKIPGVVHKMTGMELSGGRSTTSYIVMGLSDSGDGPGVFNGYTAGIYRDYGYKTDVANEISKKDLSAKIIKYINNPKVRIYKNSKFIVVGAISVAIILSVFVWKRAIPYDEYVMQTQEVENVNNAIDNGIYDWSHIIPESTVWNGENQGNKVSVYSEDGINYTIRMMETGYVICYNDTNDVILYLDDVYSLKYDENRVNNTLNSVWNIEKDEDGNNVFLNNENYYLCYNKNNKELILIKEPTSDDIIVSISEN